MGIFGFALLALVVAPVTQGAQDSDKDKASFSTVPFDIEAKMLPANYRGHNLKLLHVEFSKLLSPKGEFETTAEYEARTAATSLKPVLGKVKADSLVALQITVPFAYDADKGAYGASLFLSRESFYPEIPSDSPYKAFQFSSNFDTTKRLGTYTASNAFGTEVVVSKSERTVYQLAMANPKEWRMDSYNRNEPSYWDGIFLKLGFSIPRESAQAIKDDLRAVVVFQPAPPFATTSKSYWTPTIDSPSARTTHHMLVPGKVKAIYIYNVKSGEVYKKITPERS